MKGSDLLAIGAALGLDEPEVRGLVKVVTAPEVGAALGALKKTVRTANFVVFPAVMAAVGVVAFAFASWGKAGGASRPMGAPEALAIALFVAFPAALSVRKFLCHGVGSELKSAAVRHFFELLSPDAKYASGNQYAPNYHALVGKGLLRRYDQVDRAEDSFSFRFSKDGKAVDVAGVELETSVETRHEKGRRGRATTNKCLLVHGRYPQAALKMEADVLVKSDLSDNAWVAGASFLLPALFAGFVTAAGTTANGPYQNPPSVYVPAGLAAGAFMWYVTRAFMAKRRVALENAPFERLFDVKSDDQVFARMVLTPELMDRLVAFVAKGKGKCEFLFTADGFFVKKFLSRDFLAIRYHRDDLENVRMFMGWYVELKEVVSLVADTGVLAYARTVRPQNGAAVSAPAAVSAALPPAA